MPPTDPPPRVDRLLSDFARSVGADGITLWRVEEAFLVAVANPDEPRILGIRQPLQRGLISRVYHTGQAILEENLAAHPNHDPTVDTLLGRRCAAMMAAPFESDQGGGVVSAVLYTDGRPGDGFDLDGLKRLGTVAWQLAEIPWGEA
jgi:hypothetical protein